MHNEMFLVGQFVVFVNIIQIFVQESLLWWNERISMLAILKNWTGSPPEGKSVQYIRRSYQCSLMTKISQWDYKIEQVIVAK